MGCQAGAGGDAGRADSRAAAPWPPHLPYRRAARRDERRAPPWQLQRAQRTLQTWSSPTWLRYEVLSQFFSYHQSVGAAAVGLAVRPDRAS
eukprot:4908603-Prymnesium_polylepis.1